MLCQEKLDATKATMEDCLILFEIVHKSHISSWTIQVPFLIMYFSLPLLISCQTGIAKDEAANEAIKKIIEARSNKSASDTTN